MNSRPREGGFALLYAVGVAVVVLGLSFSLLTYAIASQKTATTKHFQVRARYLAEGAIEVVKKDLQQLRANWRPVPTAGTVHVDGTDVAFSIQPANPSNVTVDPQGIQTIHEGFLIRATARVNGYVGQARRIIRLEATPIFQFAIFYGSDLEILPGPDMVIRGRVHSNRDIYVSANRSVTLDTNYFRAAGDLYARRKDAAAHPNGAIRVRKWVANPFSSSEPTEYFDLRTRDQLAALGVSSVSGYDSDFVDGHDANGDGDFDDPGDWLPFGPGALEYWKPPSGYTGGKGHTVRTGDHGISEATIPQVQSTQMFVPSSSGTHVWHALSGTYVPANPPGSGTHDKGFFHGVAGLSVLSKADGTWLALDGSGTDVTATLATHGAVTTRLMYDHRQGGYVPVTEIDLAALRASGEFPAGGVLYTGHYGIGTGTAARGTRLRNGSELAGDVTIASDGPVYVWGDFNNTGTKRAAAVIADAVNLLSNAWNDTKGPVTGLPRAVNTTYNLAMVTGNDETRPGRYNGGFENLPRFHEDWSGVTARIVGSFVNLWESQHATGRWVYGGKYYQAPRRDWSFDPDFNDVRKLPPFTPMAISADDVVSW